MNAPLADDLVALESLVGEHELSGVDFGKLPEKAKWDYEHASTCTFVLDGQTYTAIEDPDDGYRSSMEKLVKGGVDVTNRFPSCRVICSYRIKGEYGTVDDVLVMRDVVTGKEVLIIGTDNTDDYYPSFVSDFRPEGMAINSTEASK